jgi:hypothetical protein
MTNERPDFIGRRIRPRVACRKVCRGSSWRQHPGEFFRRRPWCSSSTRPFNLWWQAFVDGRQFAPHADVSPTWHGYSTATWEGDTLVVDSRGFNGKLWLDQLGKPSTEALHVTTRFRRRDFGHMDLQITIDDPKAYTKPWTVAVELGLLPETELMEFICLENERDSRKR